MTSAAKVLDPEHLLRTDLAPHFEDDVLRASETPTHEGQGVANESEEVAVGRLRLNVASIDLPQRAT